MLDQIKAQLVSAGYQIVDEDVNKPWGGYFRIADDQLDQFIEEYFVGVEQVQNLSAEHQYSPKILVVAPGKRLSWQVHERRFEYWKVVKGPIGVYVSPTDDQPDMMDTYQEGELIIINDQIRHRLVGLEDWGVVAEIWVHTEAENPSNEEDIVRLADDFGR